MKEQLITFETAKLAKEKGFNEGCLYDYNNSSDLRKNVHSLFYNDSLDFYIVPTQSLLQKWLRQIHNINVYPILSYTNNQKYTIELRYDFSKIRTSQTGLTEKIYYDTYEEALEQGLFEGLKLIK